MSASHLLLGYSDLGLFLAVVGVYVFFAALWVVYVLTDRSEARIKEQMEGSVMELSQSNSRGLLSEHTSLMTELKADLVSMQAEIERLKTELASVREVATMSGQETESLHEEIELMRDTYEEHLDEFHADAEHAQEETVAEEPAAATMQPALQLYNPVEEISASEQAVEEDYSTYDSERGLIYLSRPRTTDNLTRIWGVGEVNQELLNENGVYYFAQIAKWNDQQIDKFNDILCFSGRIEREDWVGQAKRIVEMDTQQRAA